MIPLELTFFQALLSSGASAFFTALFVTLGAGFLVTRIESREARRRTDEENLRADALLKADRRRAEALLAAETQRADLQAVLDKDHDKRQQLAEHNFQSRSALRESYARLLVAQRRSREASVALAAATGDLRDAALRTAGEAHDEFIDEYHRLALDADRPMWKELRGLRVVLDDMLERAREGDAQVCQELTKTARRARQNLERSFRMRLGHEPLQERRPLGSYDKM